MTLTTHALVGAAAASLFPEHPYIAFAAGFASHLAIDALPHYDYAEYLHSFRQDFNNRLNTDMEIGPIFWKDLSIIAADALLGCLLAFPAAHVLGTSYAIALVGAGAGIYPDLLQFVYYKIRRTRAEPGLRHLQRFHMWLQQGKERPWWGWKKGFALQALLTAGIFIVLLLR